jgi:hypothetical protein
VPKLINPGFLIYPSKGTIVTLEELFVHGHQDENGLQEVLVRVGARHSKSVTFQLAEVAVTRHLFAVILSRIARLAIPPPVVGPIRG